MSEEESPTLIDISVDEVFGSVTQNDPVQDNGVKASASNGDPGGGDTASAGVVALGNGGDDDGIKTDDNVSARGSLAENPGDTLNNDSADLSTGDGDGDGDGGEDSGDSSRAAAEEIPKDRGGDVARTIERVREIEDCARRRGDSGDEAENEDPKSNEVEGKRDRAAADDDLDVGGDGSNNDHGDNTDVDTAKSDATHKDDTPGDKGPNINDGEVERDQGDDRSIGGDGDESKNNHCDDGAVNKAKSDATREENPTNNEGEGKRNQAENDREVGGEGGGGRKNNADVDTLMSDAAQKGNPPGDKDSTSNAGEGKREQANDGWDVGGDGDTAKSDATREENPTNNEGEGKRDQADDRGEGGDDVENRTNNGEDAAVKTANSGVAREEDPAGVVAAEVAGAVVQKNLSADDSSIAVQCYMDNDNESRQASHNEAKGAEKKIQGNVNRVDGTGVNQPNKKRTGAEEGASDSRRQKRQKKRPRKKSQSGSMSGSSKKDEAPPLPPQQATQPLPYQRMIPQQLRGASGPSAQMQQQLLMQQQQLAQGMSQAGQIQQQLHQNQLQQQLLMHQQQSAGVALNAAASTATEPRFRPLVRALQSQLMAFQNAALTNFATPAIAALSVSNGGQSNDEVVRFLVNSAMDAVLCGEKFLELLTARRNIVGLAAATPRPVERNAYSTAAEALQKEAADVDKLLTQLREVGQGDQTKQPDADSLAEGTETATI